jgi:dihydrofolate reductase
MSRKFIVYIAVTADGFIARSDGSFDFLDKRPAENHGMKAFLRSVDAIVWGRKTWDQAAMMGMPKFGPKIRNHVFSRGAQVSTGEEFVDHGRRRVDRFISGCGSDR